MTIVYSDGDTGEDTISNYPGATTAQFEQNTDEFEIFRRFA